MSDAFIREYERIIDVGYCSLPIFAYRPPTATYGVLAAFDSHIMTERMVKTQLKGQPLSLAQLQMFKFLGEGFIFAMRWLLRAGAYPNVEPNTDVTLLKDANDLIIYGSKYHRASMLYSAYSQGRMEATVDPGKRLVRFAHTAESLGTTLTWGFADEASNETIAKTPQWNKQRQRFQLHAAAAFRRVPYRLQDGRIMLTDVSLLGSEPVREYAQWSTANQRLFPDELQLDGFTMGQFAAFWRAVYVWSVCATEIYCHLCEDLNLPQEICLPTQVVHRDAFIRAMMMLSGLSHEVTARIVCQLTADQRTNKLDVYLQPLICGDETVAWSVRALQLSLSQRNLLKLMARTPKQKELADTIIGSREHALLTTLQTWFKAKGWSIEILINLPGVEQGEVDLLGWNWTYPKQILVVEAKALLQADDANEVRAATREMARAQKQLGRSIRLLQKITPVVKRQLFPAVDWSKVADWYGIVVTPEGEPGLGFDHSVFPACSFATLRHRLARADWSSPFGVWRAMARRAWQAKMRAARFTYDAFELAGVTFEEPHIEY